MRQGGRLQVIEGDALEVNPLAHLTPPIAVAANLPYNIGTELLVRWLTPKVWPPFWTSLTLMFQREVAERIVAQPGSKTYGRLAVLSQWRCDAKIVLNLPPEAFTPPPKVSSAGRAYRGPAQTEIRGRSQSAGTGCRESIQPTAQNAARRVKGA
ncbi:Ribosomal RNA small subunit methyltransferase A [Nymphon striatum]|nr:Ribosomal RNA small subunit methyltransferase A [Nymphon striatum]